MRERGIEAFDRAVDRSMARWRGNRLADAAAYAVSTLGDHGLIWFLIGVIRGRHPGTRRAASVRAVAFTGLVVPGLNAALKSAVGRVRPESHSPHVLPVRVPRTASFPSGHSLAAWCSATLLAEGDPWAPGYYLVAGAISTSRVHVRLHHATDVVAGSLLGLALGWMGRRLLPLSGALMHRVECAAQDGG
jgi:undecaprenyl-diphosphatase